MSKNYIGKTCPYCKTPLAEGDTVVICSVCDMPHHLSCWQDNQGCTTFGCTGMIKEIIGNDSGAAAASAAAPPESISTAPVAPPPTMVEQTEKSVETLYETNDMVFYSQVPVVLENTALIIDRTKDKLFARCTFRSIADKAIKAVLIKISCQDVWGDTLGEPIAYQYLDLRTKWDSKFGQTNAIDIPDKSTRKIQIAIGKVLFTDDTVVTGGDVAMTMPAPVLLSQHLQSEELAEEYARETTPKAQYVPEYTEAYWRCTCGSINFGPDEKCHLCHCTKELLNSVLVPDSLNTNMLNYVAQKRAAEEKAKAEQAERIRVAEEQVRLEQAKKEQEIMIAERREKKKKRRKTAITVISVSLVVILLLGCGTVFFGIPYFNYRAACEALDNGEYDTAYQAFLDLNGFLDSAKLASESLYQKAEAALQNKQYDVAYGIFINLGNYEDSAEMANESLYQKGQSVLNDKQFDSAIQIFEGLGDYKDSRDQILEAKYQKAEKCQTDKQYERAYKLFVELGDYKESQNKVLTTMLLWEAEALSSSWITVASSFSRTVKLDPSQYEVFYSGIMLFLSTHEDADYWYDYGGTAASKNVKLLLKMLPSTYKDTNTLLKLFNLFTDEFDWYDNIFRDNETLMRQCWSLAFIRDLAEQDGAISYFLEGYWTGSGYYLNFYEDEDGGTRCEFDLPWVSKPYGTRYYCIEDMVFYWDDDDCNHLAKVYRFEIVDYDIIKVYCYKNNRTYTLYR